MDTAWIIGVSAAGSSIVTYSFKRAVEHFLGRGKLRIDEAAAIRGELRTEIDRKDRSIDALGKRVESLEEELAKVEHERNALVVHLERYRLDVYRTLVEKGASHDVVEAILAIQWGVL